MLTDGKREITENMNFNYDGFRRQKDDSMIQIKFPNKKEIFINSSGRNISVSFIMYVVTLFWYSFHLIWTILKKTIHCV